LFYSRRIGGRPVRYGQAGRSLEEDEVLVDNPAQSRLVNAFKLSGRNVNGLAVGVFNAITDNTYARIEHPEGMERKVQTDPTTNYNILVFDQSLSNNSSAYLINTNVLRSGDFRHANVTGAGSTLVDPSNNYEVSLSGAFSQLYNKTHDGQNSFQVNLGSRYNASVSKISGNFLFSLRRIAINPEYNDNDLGLTHRTNEITDRVTVNYNIHQPFWLLRNWRNRLMFQNQGRFNGYEVENMYVEYTTSSTSLNYTFLYHGFYFHPRDRKDYYEARTAGRIYVRPRAMSAWAGISSDYRNPFALDMQVNLTHVSKNENTAMYYRIAPRYRFSDQFSFVHSLVMNYSQNDYGYAGKSDDIIVFGNRDVTTVENVFSSDYIVRNDIYFSFRLRQYWSKGEYESFFALMENGYLDKNQLNYSNNRDFNFNSFNIDLVFTWLFAPGSSLNLVWKNAILHEKSGIVNNYFDNFGLLLESPQYNSLSLKVLYHLDYQQLKGV
jgi:hypothetical protein